MTKPTTTKARLASTPTPMRVRRPARALAMLTTVALGAGLIAFTDTAGAAPLNITDATFEWSVSEEANTGSFNGQCNFMSAGVSDGYAGTYKATDGNATVLKLNSANEYVPISDYTTRCKDKDGNNVTAAGARRLGQKVRYTKGVGTADPVTGETSIQFTGTFSVNYYGTLTPFWFINPRVEVDASGNGKLIAFMAGYASSIDDPDVRELINPVANVAVATFDTNSKNNTGFVATPHWAGVEYNDGEVPQIRVFPGWGSWPLPMIKMMERLGLGAYWYTTGSAADARKPGAPLTVGFGATTAPTTSTPAPSTTKAPGSTTTAAPTTAAPTTASPTTASPTTATPTTAAPTTAAPTTTAAPGSSNGIDLTVDIPDVDNGGGENPGDGDGDGGGTDPSLPDNVFSWTIDAAQSSIVLAPVAGGADFHRFSGSLGNVTVIDTRNSQAAWSLTGQVSDFSGGLSGKYLGWTPKIVTAGAGAIPGGTVPSGFVAGNGLRDVSSLASAQKGHAKGSATIGADLDLMVPASTAGGRQTATLTLTALG
ncbi:MAG: hypothetical protein R2689_02010 [Microthrixaceae bacterium]